MMKGHVDLVGFDLDGTLIEGNTWDLCHSVLGLDPAQDRAWSEDYRAGRITYAQWLNLITEVYRRNDAREDSLTKVLSEFTLAPGATEALAYLRKQGYILAIVSGTLDLRVRIVAQRLGIEKWRANVSLRFDNMGRIERMVSHGGDLEAKEMLFLAICDEVGVSPGNTAFVGNEANDLPIFKLTGHGISIGNYDPELDAASWVQIKALNELCLLL